MTRLERSNETRQIKELNDIGKRIRWCREVLGLTLKTVAERTGIPLSTYANRETGIRTDIFEEYLAIAQVFNEEYQCQIYLLRVLPQFESKPINKITTSFLMFGKTQDE